MLQKGDKMGIWYKILDFILDYPLVTKDKAIEICNKAIDACDADADGYINSREIISLIKSILKGVKNVGY